jgi:hypothetical protein
MLNYQRVNLRPKNRLCSSKVIRPQWRRLSPQRSRSPRGRGTATCPSYLGHSQAVGTLDGRWMGNLGKIRNKYWVVVWLCFVFSHYLVGCFEHLLHIFLNYLVGGLEHLDFFHILGMSSSQLSHHFSEG